VTVERFAVELRSEIHGRTVRGHASVFGQAADLRSHFEQIGPAAFDAALADRATDVRALFNHDPSNLLGRQSSGTLRVGTDSEGLEFEVDLPDTQLGRDVAELMARGDVTGASFGFVPGDDVWTRSKDGKRLRTHTSVRSLVDVSVVTFPAYDGAGAQLRSISFDSRPDPRRRLILSRARARATYPRSYR
jgi:HK97 family phage prohead protease